MTVATFDAAGLRSAINAAKAGIGRQTHIPALAHVHITPTAVTGTDLNVTIAADTGRTGELAVLADPTFLLAALKGATGAVTIEVDGGDATLKVGERVVNWRPVPIDDWPRLDTVDGDGTVDLGDAAHVIYAASRDQSRPILTTVAFGEGHAVATDSYRLSVVPIGYDGPVRLVPATALAVAAKRDVTAVTFSDRGCRLDGDGIAITARLIDGAYPNWAQLVPTTFDYGATFDRDAARAVLDAMSWAETVRVTIAADVLSFRAVDIGHGREQSETIPADTTGGDLTVAFNVTFLDDAFAACGDMVQLDAVDSLKPTRITTADVDDGRLELLMPVRST